MKPDFDKELKAKLDDASVKDLMNDFDAAATWGDIRERMHAPEKKKAAVLPMWFTHVAACIAGIAIAWLLFFNHPVADKTKEITVVKTDTVLKTITEPAPAGMQQRPATPVVTVLNISTEKQINKELPAPVKPNIVSKETSDDSSMPVVVVKNNNPSHEAPVAGNRQVVVHMLDIDNEDQDLAVRAQPHIPGAGPVLTINKPGNAGSNAPLAITGLIQTFKPNNK